MKTITVRKQDIGELKTNWTNRSALESDYKTLITEDCILIDEDKNILVIYTTLPFNSAGVVMALDRINYDTTTRTNGLKTQSRVFGYMPRIVTRADYCRTVSLAQDAPLEHAVVCQYGIKMAEMYSKFSPEIYAAHSELMKQKVLNEYALADTPFTSGIINKNNPLKYHFDKGNFKGTYSAMAVFKHDIEGGHLSLPEYGVGIELKNNSAFMFDGQSILHGVTPIKRLSANAMRYSIVYYSMHQMWQCLPLDAEIARIRDLKTEREMKRFRRLKGQEVA